MKTDENQTEKRKETAKKNENQVKRRKEADQEAIDGGDFADALISGFERFLSFLSSGPFQEFLDRTGAYIDGVIQRSCREDSLTYVGGKLILELLDASKVKMTADFYYQNVERQWIHNQRTAIVKATRWSDWKTNDAFIKLQQEKRLEYPILPPTESGGT